MVLLNFMYVRTIKTIKTIINLCVLCGFFINVKGVKI